VGGNWSNGTKCRSGSVNWNNSPLNLNDNIGSRRDSERATTPLAGWLTYHLLQTLEITKLKEIIGMRGIPKHLNTKFDYEYIKNQNLSGWQTQYQALLDTRQNWFKTADLSPEETGATDATHRVRTETDLEGVIIKYQQELQEDPNCKLFRLGFTQAEVESALTV
jgi:hypothetical protein